MLLSYVERQPTKQKEHNMPSTLLKKTFPDQVKRVRVKRFVTVGLVLTLIAIFLDAAIGQGAVLHALNNTPTTSSAVTFRANPIPFSEQEIPNPMRGYYKWNGMEIVPNVDIDVYRRFSWRQLESARGQYDFSPIERGAQEAQSRGGKFSFRIYTFCTSYCANGSNISVPDYLRDGMPRGWNASGSWGEAYVPDWNSELFLSRTEALLTALGRKYNDDPRIGWIDIGSYGNWGEWHTWPLSYPSSTDAEPIYENNVERIIKAHVSAFTNKYLVFRMNNRFVINAMRISPKIGLRDDGFGNAYADEEWKYHSSRWEAMKDRWKTAPVVGEFWANTQEIDLAIRQAQEYHYSAIGNGNRNTSISPTLMDGLIAVGKTLGYRYQLNSISLPAQIARGASFSVASSWSNVGVAPIYERWDVMVQLRNRSTGAVVWQAKSAFDLRNLLPTKDRSTGVDTPVDVGDTFQLPATVPVDTYDLVVVVVDPASYYKPLSLAISGRRADGSYALGQVSVANNAASATATPIPSPTAAITPTPPASPTTAPVPTPVPPSSTSSAPFKGQLLPIPGTIQAEEFDNGGEGTAYHDTSPGNDGGAYRDTDVDIEWSSEGGYNIGYITQGESLTYTVDVQQAALYTIAARMSNRGSGGTFHVEFDGADKTGVLSIPNTNDWQIYQTVLSKPVYLSKGQHMMRLVMDKQATSGYVGNIDYLTIDQVASTTLPVLTVTASGYQEGNGFEQTIDGDLSTRWSSDGDGQWIAYDLGVNKTITSVDIAFQYGDARTAAFDIQLSQDNAAWTTVYSGRSSGTTLALQTFDVPAAQARFVRIVGHGNSTNSWNSLTEVAIAGVDS